MTSLNIQQSTQLSENVSSTVIEKLYNLALTSTVEDLNSSFSMNLQGNVSVPAAYEDSVLYLRSKFPNFTINVPQGKYYLRFRDPVISNFSVNTYGDGTGITQTDAAGVINNFWGYDTNIMSDDLKSLVTYLDDFLYFTGISNTLNIIMNFPNATSITFPNITIYDVGRYGRSMVRYCRKLSAIDYRNVQFVKGPNYASLPDYDIAEINVIDGNDIIADWDNSLIPNQTDLNHICLFCGWTKLLKIIYPEGITKIGGRSRGNESLLYIEFPTTIVSIGSAYGFGQDNHHRIGAMVVKATTPPNWHGWNPNDSGLSGRGFGWDNFPIAIYVPDSAVNTYKSVTNNGTNDELAWASPYVQDLIKPLSELPQIYRDMGTVTLEDIDRV